MPYGKFAPSAFGQMAISPAADTQRNSIAQALMNIRNPPGGFNTGLPGQEPGWETPMPPPQVGPTNPGMQPPPVPPMGGAPPQVAPSMPPPMGTGMPPGGAPPMGGGLPPQQMPPMGPMKPRPF